MASPENRHCANCIGILSFAICNVPLTTHLTLDVRCLLFTRMCRDAPPQ